MRIRALPCLVTVLALSAVAPATVNRIGDSDFGRPFSRGPAPACESILSRTAWTAATGSAADRWFNDSDGAPGGASGAVAWQKWDLRTYVSGDRNDQPDVLEFAFDYNRRGDLYYSGELRVQIRGVRGAEPTSVYAGTPLGTFAPSSMFLKADGVTKETHTWAVTVPNDGQWRASDRMTFDAGTDYDWYIVRIGGFAGQSEPEVQNPSLVEFELTRWAVDDVFFGIVGDVLEGDADESGTVDLADLAILATNWNMTGGASWGLGDFNADANVDLADLAILATHWNQSAGSFGEATRALGLPTVPEPAIAAMVLAGALVAGPRRSRRRRNTGQRVLGVAE